MKETTRIRTAEMAVGHNDQVFETNGVGSCVVIALYDTKKRVGGMVHAMLPDSSRHDEQSALPGKFVDQGIDNLIKEIEKIGGRKQDFEAKLIGGSRMFKLLSGDEHGIGYQNVQAAKQKLEELGISIDSEDTGGTVGRSVEFDLSNGVVSVQTKM